MTYQEQEEYNSLLPNEKQTYDRVKTEHLNWSHSQIITMVKLNTNLVNVIETGNTDPNQPKILQIILQKTKEWLVEFSKVSSSILSAIDNTISELGEAIAIGVQWIGDKLNKLLNSIFD